MGLKALSELELFELLECSSGEDWQRMLPELALGRRMLPENIRYKVNIKCNLHKSFCISQKFTLLEVIVTECN
jgi:hypothetical protein